MPCLRGCILGLCSTGYQWHCPWGTATAVPWLCRDSEAGACLEGIPLWCQHLHHRVVAVRAGLGEQLFLATICSSSGCLQTWGLSRPAAAEMTGLAGKSPLHWRRKRCFDSSGRGLDTSSARGLPQIGDLSAAGPSVSCTSAQGVANELPVDSGSPRAMVLVPMPGCSPAAFG